MKATMVELTCYDCGEPIQIDAEYYHEDIDWVCDECEK